METGFHHSCYCYYIYLHFNVLWGHGKLNHFYQSESWKLHFDIILTYCACKMFCVCSLLLFPLNEQWGNFLSTKKNISFFCWLSLRTIYVWQNIIQVIITIWLRMFISYAEIQRVQKKCHGSCQEFLKISLINQPKSNKYILYRFNVIYIIIVCN